jgi:carbon monoxide dehydrogenase subunit G
MARYTGTVQARHGADEVWDYLADLRSIRDWDPSVDNVELVSGAPGTESARYELEMRFRGRTLALRYRTVEVDPPHRVVFAADTDSVSIRDEARIEPAGTQTSTVVWDANLRLRGFRKLFELPLRVFFNRLGRDAHEGLSKRLTRPRLEGTLHEVRS